MSGFERITPEQVSAAYQRTGLTPVNCEWGFERSGKLCGCALTAISYSNVMEGDNAEFFEILEQVEETNGHSAGNYRIEYLNGFVQGYDGESPILTKSVDPDYKMGVQDGIAAFEKMKAEGHFN